MYLTYILSTYYICILILYNLIRVIIYITMSKMLILNLYIKCIYSVNNIHYFNFNLQYILLHISKLSNLYLIYQYVKNLI